MIKYITLNENLTDIFHHKYQIDDVNKIEYDLFIHNDIDSAIKKVNDYDNIRIFRIDITTLNKHPKIYKFILESKNEIDYSIFKDHKNDYYKLMDFMKFSNKNVIDDLINSKELAIKLKMITITKHKYLDHFINDKSPIIRQIAARYSNDKYLDILINDKDKNVLLSVLLFHKREKDIQKLLNNNHKTVRKYARKLFINNYIKINEKDE